VERIPSVLFELLGLIAPPRCAACASACETGEALCAGCEASLAVLRPSSARVPGLRAVWSRAPYEGVARELVAALKFRARLPLARHLARAIAERAPAGLFDGSPAIVPVPPAPARLRWRGFDAAEAIAANLALETGIPLDRCLRRSQGRRQVGRPRRERLAHPPGVRVVAAPPDRALLLDDVVTTGATLAACARALRAGGCSRLAALTFAQARE
jgi:ComF family protein